MREGDGGQLYCAKLISECCAQVAQLAGDAAEIGVYRGDSAVAICEALPGCTVHLFDTFTGIPDRCEKIDECRPGDFKVTSEERVRAKLDGRPHRIYAGIFPETAVDVPVKFVHIDCDIYRSTADAVAWAWANLVPGGVILCDDYNNSACAGAKKAIDEFLAATPAASARFEARRAIITKEARNGN